MEPISLHIVRPDGKVETLGRWMPGEKRLILERAGFPFLGPGDHLLEGDLPWIFFDMAPSGYMGAGFARQFPELALPHNPRLWSSDHVVKAISQRGEDLSGNLLVGDESRRRFFELAHLSRTRQQLESDVDVLRKALASAVDTGGSSLGGDRPKVVLHLANQSDVLVKFSPPVNTPLGARWKNLLLIERLANDVLRSGGLSAAFSETDEVEGRMLLTVERYDRTTRGGRLGAATLQYLAATRQEAELPAPAVMASLHRDALVDGPSVHTCELAHAFSAAIGNNDAHLGNYGLSFDDLGKATLSPLYDILPMVFAPRHDELPDSRVTPRAAPVDPRVVGMVADLARRVRETEQIDADFKDLWLRYVGG